MICKECNSSEVIRVYKPEHVRFECKRGHIWNEDYTDNGGRHKRPLSYEIKLEDTLFPGERVLYRKVLLEMKKNNWFADFTPEETTSYLTDTCKFDRQEIHSLFKKITDFNNGNVRL